MQTKVEGPHTKMFSPTRPRARSPSLDPRYHTRVKFPKWNIQPTVLQEPRLFPRLFPELTKADHLRLSREFEQKEKEMMKRWIRNVDLAMLTYGDGNGRLISGVVRDHFPEKVKDKLRALAHEGVEYGDAARAHWKASGKRIPIKRSGR
jgi:hypothetical protein